MPDPWTEAREKEELRDQREEETDREIEKINKKVRELIAKGEKPEESVEQVIKEMRGEKKFYGLPDGSTLERQKEWLIRKAKEEKRYLNLAEKIRRIRTNPRLSEEDKKRHEVLAARKTYVEIENDKESIHHIGVPNLIKTAEEMMEYLEPPKKPRKWGILRAFVVNKNDEENKKNEARKKEELEKAKRRRRMRR